MLLAFQLHLIQSQSSNSSSAEEDYDEGYVEQDTKNRFVEVPVGNGSDHWANCTFNGTVYFDDECEEWMRNFYVILTISVAGMALFVLLLFCCRSRLCSRRGDDFQRLIENE